MLRVLKALALSALIGAFAFSSVNQSDAQVIPVPIGIPIASCGTVGVVPSVIDTDGNGQLDDYCKVWLADSPKGAFLVAGIGRAARGARLNVQGLICLTCLTTCQAGAILNAKVSQCK